MRIVRRISPTPLRPKFSRGTWLISGASTRARLLLRVLKFMRERAREMPSDVCATSGEQAAGCRKAFQIHVFAGRHTAQCCPGKHGVTVMGMAAAPEE